MRSAFYNLINFINMTNIHDVYWGAAKKYYRIFIRFQRVVLLMLRNVLCIHSNYFQTCRKLNYESFADFKKDVTMNLHYFNQDAKRLLFDHQLPSPETIGEGKEIFKNHFQNVIRNLQDTYDNIRYEDLIYIVDKIHDAKHICFAGNFFTQSVSMQLQIELCYLGKDCVAMYPLEQQKKTFIKLKGL